MNENFGQRLKRLREQDGYTQERLAELSGLKHSTISRIESGIIAAPSIETVCAIAKELRLSVDELIGDTFTAKCNSRMGH